MKIYLSDKIGNRKSCRFTFYCNRITEIYHYYRSPNALVELYRSALKPSHQT